MPIVYKILQTPRVHLVSYQGIATNEELLACYKEAYRDPLYVPGIPEISDVRHVLGIDIDFYGIRALVDWVDGRDDLVGTNTRVGILQNDETLVGISKLYAAVSDAYDKETVQIFSDLPPMLDWLPLDPNYLSTIQSELAGLVQAGTGNHPFGDADT